VIVNYLRMALGQERGGHISPLAAYDAETDRFLALSPKLTPKRCRSALGTVNNRPKVLIGLVAEERLEPPTRGL
jgi:hypothetical protein